MYQSIIAFENFSGLEVEAFTLAILTAEQEAGVIVLVNRHLVWLPRLKSTPLTVKMLGSLSSLEWSCEALDTEDSLAFLLLDSSGQAYRFECESAGLAQLLPHLDEAKVDEG